MARSQPSRIGGKLLLGALAGIAGTVAMTAAMRALHRRLPGHERYPLPPREIIEGTAPEHALEEADRQELTLAAHFGYGAATGALYAVIRPREGALAGALYGVLVWAGSYLGWVPGARILQPATRHPWRRNGLMIAAHLVWGATTALSLRELERANAEIFATRMAPDRPRQEPARPAAGW